MNLSELFLKLIDEDDISSESKLFDSQEVIDVLNMAKKGENSIKKLDELIKPLAKAASEQLAVLIHYMDM